MEYQTGKGRPLTNQVDRYKRQNVVGQKKLVFEPHPEEYLEQRYNRVQMIRLDTSEGSIETDFLDDAFNIDLKTGSYSVRY